MIYNRINLFVPTYNRADDRLPRFVSSFSQLAFSKQNYCFTFCVNEEDTETKNWINTNCKEFDCCVIEENEKPPNLAKYYNLCYANTKFKEPGTIVSMCGDDFECRTRNWDLVLLAEVNRYGGVGIFYGDDVIGWHSKLCVNLFVTREMIEAQRPFAFMAEEFLCDYIDVVWQKVGEGLNRAFYIDDLKIYHDHSTLPGRVDATWRRLRRGIYTSMAKANMVVPMANERVAAIKKNLCNFFGSEIDVVMTTKDRVDLLTSTINTYTLSSEKPKALNVFDDCSKDPVAVKAQIDKLSSVVFDDGGGNPLGCGRKTPDVLRFMFEAKKSKAVLILDSDTSFYKTWWQGCNAIYNELKNDKDFGALTLYNGDYYYPTKKSARHPAVREANSCGAFGLVVTREFWEKYIKDLAVGNWDLIATQNAAKDGKKIYVCAPCFLQHTGTMEGAHTSRECEPNVAEDFLGMMSSEIVDATYQPVVNTAPHPVATGSKILWAVYARRGDVIAASVIANFLLDRGYKLTWLTLPMHEDLVDLVCPNVPVKKDGYPNQHDWYFTTVDHMKQQFPGYDCYINAQFGASENHDAFADAEPNMLEWLLRRVGEILGKKYSCDDWKPYFRLRYDRKVSAPNVPQDKPLALIAPGGRSSPILSLEDIEGITKDLSSRYHVRQIVSHYPQGVSAREIREKYIGGMTFVDSIFFMKQYCRYFVGNNSGLAWASMYGDCLKQIWHKPHTAGNRIVRAGTYFSKIDSKATDILGKEHA